MRRLLSGSERAFRLVLALLYLQSCYALQLQSSADYPIHLNHQGILAGTSYRVVRHFYREVQMDYIFGANDQEGRILNKILNEERKGKNAFIINLEIRRSYAPVDVTVSLFTLGIYSRSWLIVEGDLIQWQE